jgi:hypothetical protein
MKFKTLILFFGIAILYSNPLNAQKKAFTGTPTVIDTTKHIRFDKNTDCMVVGFCQIRYIGINKEVILVSEKTRNIGKYTGRKQSAAYKTLYKAPKSKEISIFVDTTHSIIEYSSSKYPKAYPVILTNTTQQTLIIGESTHVKNLLVEAQNEKGEWHIIEGGYSFFCANGVYPTILPKNELLITTAPIYQKGSFKTKIRLRYICADSENIFSNEYMGSINPNQFDYNCNTKYKQGVYE